MSLIGAPSWRRAALVGGLLALLAGCTTGIGVRKVDNPSVLADFQASIIESKDLSPRTLQTLRQLDLVSLYHQQPTQAFNRLHELAVHEATPDLLFALAEMSYRLGRETEQQEARDAVVFYYLCAGYAYHYLFDLREPRHADKEHCAGPKAQQPEEAFDPRFRLACDLYNAGLAKCIRTAQRVGRLDPRHTLELPTADGGRFTLSIAHHNFAWRQEEFGPLLHCADYQVVGLDNQYRSYGLGVPLIGTRVPAPTAAPGHAFYPADVSFPVTAFFRFDGTVGDLGARHAGQLELYNPLAVRQIRVGCRHVPLECDLTTPLAYFLSRTDLERFELRGFLYADSLRDRAGIYLLEPYQPGKIPVLMVHGLLSSPVTWAPLVNELRADPTLNERYQIWFYYYPTGNPYLASAAELRMALDRLRADLDPKHQDPALHEMVLVGHSMGGLVSKLITQSSGDDFWRLASERPFQELKANDDDRAEVQRVFYFEPEGSVKRVIFLGTPHHGSKLSPSPPARLLARLIQLPAQLRTLNSDLTRDNPDFWKSKNGAFRIPTSIDLLSPGAPALELLASRPAPSSVAYHSIIGVAFGHGEKASDGVVPYQSAHIDGVESELTVSADHLHVHHHPRAALEVRRILHEHLRRVDQGSRMGQGVIPAAALLPPPGP
jgi:pimeloyl-ACP methyl ester carboxylesterase